MDKNPAYPVAIQELKEENRMLEGMQIRQVKYHNNMVEQDHRFIKKARSFDVRIEIISYSYLHTEWHRSHACD